MFGEEQEIVGQIEVEQLRDAAAKVRPQDEVVVGLVVDYVADADQFGMLGESLQLLAEPVRAQIHPADDTLDEGVLFCEFQEPAGFFEVLPGLYGDAAVELNTVQQWLQVVGEEVLLQSLHLVRHPGVLGGAVAPEVLVGIESHEFGWL